MAIAGVEPVSYLHMPNGNADEIYTREQVREILIKQMSQLIEYPFVQTPNPERYGEVVDEFMESGGVEK